MKNAATMQQDQAVPSLALPALRQQAIDLHKQNKPAEAIKLYRRYLAAVPNDTGIWNNLGAALRVTRQYSTAIACYQRVLEIKPDDAAAMSNLGNALKDMDRLEESLAYHAKAHYLEPDNRTYHMNYAVALQEAKRFPEALEHVNALLAQDPGNTDYQFERSFIHLYMGRFKEAWVDYETRWQRGDMPQRNFPFPKWQGESLQGKTILLVAEQGYGDTILAARFIPMIKAMGATVVFECKTELQPVFAALPVDRYIDARRPLYDQGKIDCYCHMMSLMGALGVEVDTIPSPITVSIPDASKKKFEWISKQGNQRKKIGIVWSGSLTFKNNAKRACSLEPFLQLAEIPGVQLYSFQKGELESDLEKYEATPLITDLSKQLDHFGDTAAAIEAMDMIVMTDSSVAHLAGSLGKPVINLLQYKPFWIYYPDTDTTPWYSSMTLIRQESPGDWEGVFSRLKQLLRADSL